MKNSTLTIVLGMHRSGTSVITSLIESCGISTGNNLQSAGDDNPKGYWEDEFIVNTNNRLLRSLGLEWHSLVLLSANDLKASGIYQQELAASRVYVSALLASFPNLVIKDPRMALTLPFWLEVFSTLNTSVNYVVTKRDPAAICRSLVRRDQFDEEYAAQLIYLYWASILHHLPSTARKIVVHYEQVKSAELSIKQELSDFLAIAPKASLATTHQFDAGLDHSIEDDLQVGFVWQQDFFNEFPTTTIPYEKIKALQSYYNALSLAYFSSHLQRTVTHELTALAGIFSGKKIALYGASELAGVVAGVLNENIVLAVDRAAITSAPIKRFGLCFEPLATLNNVEVDCIVVGVTGRKSDVFLAIEGVTSKPVFFLEDWLFTVKMNENT